MQTKLEKQLKAEIKELKHRNTMMNGAFIAKDIVDKHEIEKTLKRQKSFNQIEEISRLAAQVQQIEVAHIFFANINKLSLPQ